jgi:hypothetical protein
LDSASALYYLTTTTQSGNTSDPATVNTFSNALNVATLTLASSGVLTYDLQAIPAVPVPPSLWLMGTGLAAMGAFMRRRRAATQA